MVFNYVVLKELGLEKPIDKIKYVKELIRKNNADFKTH